MSGQSLQVLWPVDVQQHARVVDLHDSAVDLGRVQEVSQRFVGPCRKDSREDLRGQQRRMPAISSVTGDNHVRRAQRSRKGHVRLRQDDRAVHRLHEHGPDRRAERLEPGLHAAGPPALWIGILDVPKPQPRHDGPQGIGVMAKNHDHVAELAEQRLGEQVLQQRTALPLDQGLGRTHARRSPRGQYHEGDVVHRQIGRRVACRRHHGCLRVNPPPDPSPEDGIREGKVGKGEKGKRTKQNRTP